MPGRIPLFCVKRLLQRTRFRESYKVSVYKKGMCPEGVYVRQSYSSIPATDTQYAAQPIGEIQSAVFSVCRAWH